jgi:hypothetical protein
VRSITPRIGQLQWTPMCPTMPECGSCAKNGVEDKSSSFRRASCRQWRRRVVRASEPIHDPLPPPPLICMLTVRVGHALQQHAIKGGEESTSAKVLCTHTHTHVQCHDYRRETHTASHSHTTHISCSSSMCNTHSTHTPRAWPAQQHTQRSRTKPTRSHARNHLVIVHTVGGPDRSCVRRRREEKMFLRGVQNKVMITSPRPPTHTPPTSIRPPRGQSPASCTAALVHGFTARLRFT